MSTDTSATPRKRSPRRPRGPKTPTGPRRDTVTVIGTLRVNPRGFAFIDPPGIGDGWFVAAKMLGRLLDGDRVQAKVIAGTDRVVAVTLLERARTRVDGLVAADGHTVRIDPGVGAGTYRSDAALTPDTVVSFAPDGERALEVRAIGSLTDPATVATFLHDRYQLPTGYSDEVSAAAGTVTLTAGAGSMRRDLRDQLVITIDDDSTQDLDDALAATVDADGSIRVWVHIADVAEVVTAGSVLDAAARACPTSVYLPQQVRHMLPPSLGAELLSLHPGVDRNTLCAELRISPEGQLCSVDVYEATIRSRSRLSYITTQRILDGADTDTADEIVNLVRVLRAAAGRLDIVRSARGGADALRFEQDNGSSGADRDAHQLIERLMVAANEAVASWLAARGLPCLWRVHAAPGREAAVELEQVAAGFGVFARFGDPVTPTALAAVVGQVPDGPRGAAFFDALLGLLGRASYTTVRAQHFGLGSSGYTHFTSPLRRYPDLLIHRVVKSYLHGERDTALLGTGLAEAAEIANLVFRRATQAERAATLAAGLRALKPRQRLQATAVRRQRGGTLVRLDAHPGVTGIVDGDIAPGARLQVRVRRVDVFAGSLELTRI
jgi:ribonuclease R